ncbi:MAG: hypothetical protein KDA93_25260 [Planctomycetaceae bacterium]|nr:hypothetical protein [Planctomycetaceae bacterium]
MDGLPIFVGRQTSSGFGWETCSTVAELNATVAQHDGDVFLTSLGPEEIGRPDFGQDKFDTVPYVITVDELSFELIDIWQRFPPRIAVRIACPESHAFVRIPANLLASGKSQPFRDVSHPVWDWLIRHLDIDPTINLQHKTRWIGGPVLTPPSLVPSRPARELDWLRDHLKSPGLIETPASPTDEIALRAGLLQIHDFLDESHQLSQSVEGEGRHASGDYWHAIMHRREPDYGNSKYWFRRVGQHPIFGELAWKTQAALTDNDDPDSTLWQKNLGSPSDWDAFAFVDMCEAFARQEDCPLGITALLTQWSEMKLLLIQTYHDAVGK